MINITFSADEGLIEAAQEEAHRRGTTLDSLFNSWLAELVATSKQKPEIDRIMEKMDHYNAGGPFARDEMNR